MFVPLSDKIADVSIIQQRNCNLESRLLNQNTFLNKIHLIKPDRKQFTQSRMRTGAEIALSKRHLNNYSNMLQGPTRKKKKMRLCKSVTLLILSY